jgi:phage terminase large subunit-like protein
VEQWKQELEDVLRQIPGYNPWDQVRDVLIEKMADQDGDGGPLFRLRDGQLVPLSAVPVGAMWLDHAAAVHAINWFPENLKHVEGSARGEPFLLRPWQAAIVGNTFGWKRKDDAGRIVRRYRMAFIEVGRGNGKTPLTSGMVLYSYYNDAEPGAQDYLAAGQREQAGILFRNAVGMVDQNEELASRVTIYRGAQHRSMTLNDDPMSFIKVIPADAAGQHGGIPHMVAVDEVHVQESRDLLDVFETGMSKKTRAQPLLALITTADYDRPSVCNEVEDYAAKVRDNGGDKSKPGFDPSFLPVLYKVPAEADWEDEATWPLANPNLDVSVSRESLRKACQKAIEQPAFENAFRRLHLNQKTAQALTLIKMAAWDACCDKSLTLEAMKGKRCWAGLDMASKEDLCSLALIFDYSETELALFTWAWCPEAKVAARAKKKVPYDVWVRQGHLIATPGDTTDYSAIRKTLVELDQMFGIGMLYADPREVRETAIILMEQHGFAERFMEITQNFQNLSGPTKDLIFRAKHKSLRHNGNPVLRWAVSNLAGHFQGAIPNGEKLEDFLDKVPVMPSKQKSRDKIDPVAASVNALAAKSSNPMAGGGSVYEKRGILVL